MAKSAFRILENALSLISLLALGGSVYVEYGLGFLPCPLCLMQRLCLIFLVVCGGVGFFIQYKKCFRYCLLTELFFSAAGLFFASRQLWLQSVVPSETMACLPGIEMLLHYFPWQELVHVFLWGSSSCGEMAWTALGWSMAAWSAVYFGLFFFMKGLMLIWLLFRL